MARTVSGWFFLLYALCFNNATYVAVCEGISTDSKTSNANEGIELVVADNVDGEYHLWILRSYIFCKFETMFYVGSIVYITCKLMEYFIHRK